MSVSLSPVLSEATRPWTLLKVQAVAHAVLGLLIGVGSLYVRAWHPGLAGGVLHAALFCAWIYSLVCLRRKSVRLRSEHPLPERGRLLPAAFPLLQLVALLGSALLSKPEMAYLVLTLTSLAVFAIVVLSGVCFAVAAVPVRWEAWGITLGASLLSCMGLVWVALSQVHWGC